MALSKIKTNSIEDDAVTATQIAADAVGTSEIATDAVASAEIAANAVDTAEIAASAVETAKILDANVTLAKIASQAANTVLVRDASSSGVVSAKAVATTELLIGDGTGFTAAALSGDTTMTNAGAVTIADNAVSLAKMAGLARGKLIVGDASGDPSALTVGTSGQYLTSDGTDASWGAVVSLPSQTSKAGYSLVTDGTDASWAEGPNRNALINGDMNVSQRIGTTLTTIPGSSSFYGLDRWSMFFDSQSGHKVQQVTDAPPGFGNSLKFTVAAGGTPTSGSQNTVSQLVEGLNWSRFGFGAATASSITVSFWVKCSLTGDFPINIKNNGENRVYVQSYAISSADTWEKKSITIPGDTSGTWLTTSGIGAYVGWDLGSSTDRRGTAGAWGTSDIDGVTGDVVLMATGAATWQISGVQVEAGAVATTFEHKTYGQELEGCQRYYLKLGDTGGSGYATMGFATAASTSRMTTIFHFPTTMRGTPSSTYGGTLSVLYGTVRANITSAPDAQLANYGGYVNYDVSGTPFTAYTYSGLIGGNGDTSTYVAFNAEL